MNCKLSMKIIICLTEHFQHSVESKVMTTTAFKDIVPTVFECGDRCRGEVGGEVDRRLEAVLARLVSDYRAIFVIEEEVIEGGARFVFGTRAPNEAPSR